MKKIYLTVVVLFFTISSYAQLDVPPYAGGYYPGGSLLTFSSGGADCFIQEGWGLNIAGDNMHPVKIPYASVSIGYESNNQDFGLGNLYVKGNVGIGTLTPQEALTVNGAIHSKSVKIDLVGFPDYVFNTDYSLMSLSEVKNYIDKNHHLPEMPSEKEVTKNGINVGEMDKTLVKKVEELTLYLIEKDNQLKEQQSINGKIQTQLMDQKKTIENLSDKLQKIIDDMHEKLKTTEKGQ